MLEASTYFINAVNAANESQKQIENIRQCSNVELTFPEIIDWKNITSPQKFSGKFDEIVCYFLNLKKRNSYAKFDASDPTIDNNEDNKKYDTGGNSVEIKYSTQNDEKRTYSFPQIIRRNNVPNYYLIFLFSKNKEFIISKILGHEMHNSIIDNESTAAHNGNQNERRINFKENSAQESFILEHRDFDLEKQMLTGKFLLKKKG